MSGELLIRGGRVVDSEGERIADVLVRSGDVVAVGDHAARDADPLSLIHI